MHVGLVISVLLHLALLGWALFTIQTQQELRAPEPEVVAVDLISTSELTKLRQGVRTAKQLEAEPPKETPKPDVAKKEAPKPAPVAAAPPPPEPPPTPKDEPKAVLPTPPLPAPAVDEQKQVDELLLRDQERQAAEQQRLEEERRQAEVKRKQEDERRRKDAELKKKRDDEKRRREAEARKKPFDGDNIKALLNIVPDKGAPPPSSAPTEPTKAKGPALGAPEGRDKQLSASELGKLQGIIQSHLKPCWHPPAAGGGAETPVVTLRWRMKPDGSVDGEPKVENPRSDTLFRVAAEAALRAVQQCSPIPLPPDKYGHWKTITWDFDPRQML